MRNCWILKRVCDLQAFCGGTRTDKILGRRRALDRAMDEALKKPTKRRFRKADGIVCVALPVDTRTCANKT